MKCYAMRRDSGRIDRSKIFAFRLFPISVPPSILTQHYASGCHTAVAQHCCNPITAGKTYNTSINYYWILTARTTIFGIKAYVMRSRKYLRQRTLSTLCSKKHVTTFSMISQSRTVRWHTYYVYARVYAINRYF